MQLIASDYDSTGQLTGRSLVDHRDAPLTPLQLQHVRMGLEVVVFAGKRRLDYRRADRPEQPLAGRGAGF